MHLKSLWFDLCMIDFEEVLSDPIHEMFYDLIWIICTYNAWKACVLETLENIFETNLFLNLPCVSIIRIDLKSYGKLWIEARCE